MSYLRLLVMLLLLPAVTLAADEAPSSPVSVSFELVVDGKSAVQHSVASLAQLPPASVTDASHDEPPSLWTGVALVDVLRQAGVPLGQSLRGAHHAKIVRVTAADGYQVVFSLAELDEGFGQRRVLLVHQRDGRPLAEDGPFRLVVPQDERAGRWLRNLVRIEVLDAGKSDSNPKP